MNEEKMKKKETVRSREHRSNDKKAEKYKSPFSSEKLLNPSEDETGRKDEDTGRSLQNKNGGEAEVLTDKASSSEEKLKQALNDNLYLRAEFENFKRRSSEEKLKLLRYSDERFISSLADEVLDDLDRAMLSAQEEQSFQNLKEGLEMIQKKLSQLLQNFGVEVLDPTGKIFDPSYQEALSYVESSKFPEGHVAKTFKKAYKLHDKVIRPAQVILAKKKEDS